MRVNEKVQRMTGLAVFSAVIVVLQLVATFIKFGPFSITLALAPIIIGAALYGPRAGAFLGGVFGVVVLIACIMNWDVGGGILWNTQPLLTAALCIVKGAAAGLAGGLVYKALSKRNVLAAVVLAGVVSPIANTGIFLLGLYFPFHSVLVAWANDAGAEVTTYILTGLVGFNFVLELAVNLVLSSVIVRVISARKHTAPRFA